MDSSRCDSLVEEKSHQVGLHFGLGNTVNTDFGESIWKIKAGLVFVVY